MARAKSTTLAPVAKTSLRDFGTVKMTRFGVQTLKRRAIPNLSDGMKPSHRRLLWAMYQLRLNPTAKHVKTARVLGDTIGKYHPHGDAGLKAAIETLHDAAESLIDDGGTNWGTLTDPPAAYRYTESRMTAYAWSTFFASDHIKSVPMVQNYDDSRMEPVFLPAQTINLLVNGTSGIAVGTTSDIPSFTAESVNRLLHAMLSSKKRLTPKQFYEILSLSHPLGAVAAKGAATQAALMSLMTTGTGRIVWTPKYRFDRAKRTMTVTGFVSDLRNEGYVKSAKGERPRGSMTLSGLHPAVKLVEQVPGGDHGIQVVIHFRPNMDLDDALADILKIWSSARSYRVAYLLESVKNVDGEPVVSTQFQQTGIVELAYNWLDWRRDMERRTIKWRYAQLKASQVDLRMLKLAHDNRKVLDDCRDKPDPAAYLIKTLKITSPVSTILLGMTVRQLTKLSKRDMVAELAATTKAMRQLKVDHGRVDVFLRAQFAPPKGKK